MLKKLRSFIAFLILVTPGYVVLAQSGTTTVNVDLSGATDTSVTIKDIKRNGNWCGDNNCVVFNIKVNPGTDLINFDSDQHTGASFYSINCGPQIPSGTPACIAGQTNIQISFCKPGGNLVTFFITSTRTVKASGDLNLRQGCSGTMSVTGLQPATVVWTSIFPGAQGAYDSYLNPANGSSTTTVTPQIGAPAYIDYKVTGNQNTICTGAKSDTVRVYTTPPLTVSISPASPVICPGANVLLTATPSGGAPGYTYLWNTGATTPSISVSSPGTYTVSVTDQVSGCPAVTQSVTVGAAATPAAPTASGTTICSGSTATLTATAPGGTYRWYDAASGGNLLFTGASFTTPVLTTTTTYYVETLLGCVSSRTPVTVSVTQPPAAPAATGMTICSGTTASLLATAPGGTYQWFDAASGGTLLSTGANFVTPALTASTTYYVQTTVNGCAGPRTAVTVTVTPLPAAPTAAGATICSGSTATLTASAPGGTYEWYDNASGGMLLATGASFTTPVLNTSTTYYVQATVNGCTGPRSAVTVTVNPPPAAPTASGTTICSGATATLTATAPGGTYRWFDAASGGTLLFTGNNFTTPALTSNTTYYVETLLGCLSSRTPVTVSVTPPPAAPTVSGTTICAGSTATFVATAPGGTYQWYDAPAGGTLLQTGISFTTPALSTTTTYYVQTTVNGCPGPRTAVTATVTPLPAAPTASGATICQGNSTTLTATGGGSYQWYSAASGGTLLGTSASYTTPSLNATTTYFVQTTVNGCTSARTPVEVTVIPEVNPEFKYSSGTFCITGDPTVSPQILNGPGNFSGSAGLVINSTTGEINVVASGLGVYTVTYTSTSQCPRTTSTTITITGAPDASFTYSGTFCIGGPNPLPIFTSGSAGVFSSTAGLDFVNTSTGEINLATSIPGTYTITNTISGAGCADSETFTITINASPVAPTVSGTTTICEGNSTTLTATAPGGSYQWFDAPSGGNLLSSSTTLNTGVLNNTITFYVEATVGGCTGPRTAVTVTVNPAPPAPTASGTTICAGSTATLVATAPGGTYRWYDAPTGGNLLETGMVFTTSALLSNTIFYLETTINGCPSPRTAVTVVVTPIPVAPAAPGTNICTGTSTTLTVTGSGGTYQWYDAANGGNLIATGPTFTTPILTASTAYYVQETVSGCPGPRTRVDVTVSPIPPAPTASGTTICSGSTAALTAFAPGATYRWYSTASGGISLSSSASYNTPVLTVSTTYYVEAIVNGCTGPRTAVTVNVTPAPPAVTVSGATICSGSTATLVATAPGGIYEWYAAASGGMPLATSPTFTSPVLTTSTTYYVQAVVNGCPGPRTAVNVIVNPIPVAPTAANASICTGSTATLTASAPGGTYDWYDAAVGGNLVFSGTNFTTPVLTSSTSYFVQATVNGCTGPRTRVNVTVSPIPAAPTAAGTIICSGNTATLTASAPGGIYQWYDAPSAGNLLLTGPSFTSPVLTATTTYYVQTTVNGCPGPRTAVTVTVTPIPPAPTVSAPIICAGTNATLTATAPGGNYQWYDAASGGTLLQTGSTYTTPVLNTTTTFYVQSTINGCTSPRVAVTVATVPITNPEFEYSSGTYCKSGPAVTPAPVIYTPGGGTFSATPGLVFANNTTGEIDVTATPLGTYTITFTNNSQCPRSSSVNITITNAPDASFSYHTNVFCIGSADVLPIFPAGASAGVFSSTPGLVFISPSTGELNLSASKPGTYLVTNYIAASGGCAAATASFSVTINPSPPAPLVSTTTICSGNVASLTASAPGGTYQWFDAAIGGNLINTGSTFQTPVLFTTTTYYIQTTVNGCTSTRTAATVTVNPVIDPEFEYSSGTYCKSGTTRTPAPIIHTVGGGTFSSTSGLVFANINTGEIDVSASLIGTYTVTFTNNSPCPRTTSAKITITNFPDATFSFTGPHCQGGANPIPNFSVGASTGYFTSSSPALVFVSTSTGEIDMKLSSPGTYTITNTIAASGGCAAATYSSTITIIPIPPVPTISNVSICAGSSATLVVEGTGVNYQWFNTATGGTMIGTGATFITPVLSSTTRYYVQAINGACPSQRKEVLVNVNPIPTPPVVISNSPVCTGNSIVLGAGYVPGAVYTWKGPGNFSSNLQNPFINSATLANSGTYSLFITVNGCSSPVTTVDVKVNALPVVTTGPDQTVCISSNSVGLTGTVSGLSNSGIWSTSGIGVFSPSNTSLNATYVPSNADKANLRVVLTLTSLNNQSCAPAVSSMTVNFVPLPVVNAGVNQVICANVSEVNLTGLISGATGGTWSTTGDGSFTSSNSLKTTYKPGPADIKNKAVTLSLTSAGNGLCSAVKDDLLVTINPLPVVSAGKDITILQDQTVTLESTSNTSQVQYNWAPAIGLNNYTARNPVFNGTSTQTYTLTITNEWGCVASDDVTITVLEPIKIPNTFTPNGDGVNDIWNIAKLKDYPDAVVNVYNRYGVKIFYSEGYDQPWDGTFNGTKVPFGTYYYLIDTKFPGQVFSGYILVME